MVAPQVTVHCVHKLQHVIIVKCMLLIYTTAFPNIAYIKDNGYLKKYVSGLNINVLIITKIIMYYVFMLSISNLPSQLSRNTSISSNTLSLSITMCLAYSSRYESIIVLEW